MPVPKFTIAVPEDFSITEKKLAPLSVSTSKLQDASVTEAKLATGAVTADKLAVGSISGASITDDSITAAKVEEDLKAWVVEEPMPGLTVGANKTIEYVLRNPFSGSIEIIEIVVLMQVVNTIGAYTFDCKKGGTTVLDSAPFDMTGLTNGTPAAITLKGSGAELTLAPNELHVVELTSDNAGFDGEGIYFWAKYKQL